MSIKSINGETLQVDAAGIEDGAVTTAKIADGTVTDDKLAVQGGVLQTIDHITTNVFSAMEQTRNLNTSPVGRWYAATSGTSAGTIVADTAGTHVGMREYVAVQPSTSYYLKAFNIGGTIYIVYCDSDGDFISYEKANNGGKERTVTTPDNCGYITAFNYAGAGIALNDNAQFLITESDNAHTYIQPYSAIDLTARESIADVDEAVDERIDAIDRQLADGTETTRNANTSAMGRYAVRATGIIEAATDSYYGTAAIVAVKPSTTYTATLFGVTFDGNGTAYVGEYDTGGTFIQRTTFNNVKYVITFTTDADTRFVALYWYKAAGIALGETSSMQVEEGTQSTEYIPPYTFVDHVAREGAVATFPAYFLENVQAAVAKVNDDLLTVGRHGDAFVFVTDVHWRRNKQHSPQLVKYVLDNTHVRMVINGGDNIDGHLTTKDGAAAEVAAGVDAFVYDGIRCLGVMGNHDNNQNNNAEHPESYLSQDEQFTLINRAYGSDGLQYGDGNWYFWDNGSAKVRYYFLDWGADGTAQASWIAATMGALPTGYKVVVVIHGIYKATGDTAAPIAIERTWVLPAFSDYLESVLFFIQGHTHLDAVTTPYDGDSTPVIITSCDTCSEAAGAVAGTITEQCIDVVVFDYDAGVAKITRIGRGSDRTVSL